MGAFPPRSVLAARQLEQLHQLLREARATNSFYKAKFEGLPGAFASLLEFSRAVPFTTKTELVRDQQGAPPYGSNLTYPLERYTRFHQTSGTSGAPLRWLDTPESWQWMVESWGEVYRAAGVTSEDRIFFAFSFGPFIGFWLAFEAGTKLGALCYPGGGLSSSARLKMIVENGATVICCTPTYALRLAEVAATEQLDLRAGKVRMLIVAGEPGGSIPAVRAKLESLWPGARVFDHHGMTEVGPVTYECPRESGVLHVNENAYLPEIIDPETGILIAPGEVGELVLTTLGRIGSPLIRYRTGDLTRAPQGYEQLDPESSCPCACGRDDLRLEGGILGRSDEMVVVRGVNVYPSAIDELIRGIPAVGEYQARVHANGALMELSITIEVAPEVGDPEAVAQQLRRAFQSALALRVPVTVVEAGTLPRFEMKARRWVRGG